MKAVVLGCCGYMGNSTVAYLREQRDISNILLTDIDKDKLKEVIEWLNDDRFSSMVLDINNYSALVDAVKGRDIVLNCSSVADKVPALKAALEVGANYVDTGFSHDEQLKYHNDFKKRGLTAIVGMYFSPGLDNILAHYAIERLDRIDSVDFRWSVVDIVPPEEHTRPLYWGFSLAGIISHHYGLPSRKLVDGKMIELPWRAEPEMFNFKGPIGTTEVAGLPGESLVFLNMNFPEIKNITFKEALGIDFNKKLSFLAKLGFNRSEPIEIDGQLISPVRVFSYLAENCYPPEEIKDGDIRHGGGVIVKGVKDGQKIEYNIQMWPSEKLVQKNIDMGCQKIARSGTFRNGSPLSSVAILILKGLVKEKGVFVPGLVEPPEEFIKQEVAMGQSCEISKTIILD